MIRILIEKSIHVASNMTMHMDRRFKLLRHRSLEQSDQLIADGHLQTYVASDKPEKQQTGYHRKCSGGHSRDLHDPKQLPERDFTVATE